MSAESKHTPGSLGVEALKDARHEATCMRLDIDDAIGTAKSADAMAQHLNEAIRRHALIATHLRAALTELSHRRRVLSMTYPTNLGGGFGPDRPDTRRTA